MLFTKDVFKSDQKTDYNNKKVEGFKMTFDIRRSNIDSSKGLKCNLFLLLNCAFLFFGILRPLFLVAHFGL